MVDPNGQWGLWPRGASGVPASHGWCFQARLRFCVGSLLQWQDVVWLGPLPTQPPPNDSSQAGPTDGRQPASLPKGCGQGTLLGKDLPIDGNSGWAGALTGQGCVWDFQSKPLGLPWGHPCPQSRGSSSVQKGGAEGLVFPQGCKQPFLGTSERRA